MTADEVMAKLRSMGSEKVRQASIKRGAPENQFGLNMSQIRDLAKEIKTDTPLARELWKTGQFDAMMLATLIIKPKELERNEVEAMIAGTGYWHVTDYLMTNVVKLLPYKGELMERWRNSDNELVARAGWSLLTERVVKGQPVDIPAVLAEIESDMKTAPPHKQWMMNYCLAEIGINHADVRERCIGIGEKLGVYIDYPVSKGCTSPYAPIWIRELVKRKQGG